MRWRRDDGFTLIELMMVIAIIGILATALIPNFGDFKTAAKITGVETNVRSVVITISGMSTTVNVADSLTAAMNNMSNPITNVTGVATYPPTNRTQTKAVYVFPSTNTVCLNNTLYNGAVIVLTHDDFSADVYGLDEYGSSIASLYSKVER